MGARRARTPPSQRGSVRGERGEEGVRLGDRVAPKR